MGGRREQLRQRGGKRRGSLLKECRMLLKQNVNVVGFVDEAGVKAALGVGKSEYKLAKSTEKHRYVL